MYEGTATTTSDGYRYRHAAAITMSIGTFALLAATFSFPLCQIISEKIIVDESSLSIMQRLARTAAIGWCMHCVIHMTISASLVYEAVRDNRPVGGWLTPSLGLCFLATFIIAYLR